MDGIRQLFSFPADPTRRGVDFAVDEWEEAARLDPQNVELRMYLCRRLASLARFEDAMRHCDDCLRYHAGGSPLSNSRRLRIIVMRVRLNRANDKARALMA